MDEQRLFIVANRLPICISEEKDAIRISLSSGGLVTAINSYIELGDANFSEIYWAGVPGCTPATWQKAARQLPETEFTYLPVMLFKEQYERYYNGFSNCTLWPLFHYFPSYAEYSLDNYGDYLLVNEHFAALLEQNLREGDVVWIHDYHLLPLAGMLRKAIPGLTIGFFLHIPFPSYEVFRLMPKKWQQELISGMLGADLVGFHTMDYAAHFLQTAQMVLGATNERGILRYDDRLVKVDVFPISIDYDRFNTAYDDEQVITLRNSLKEKMQECKIIFSVDRLDYSKGVHNRLKAYEYFLRHYPEYHNKVVFIIVVVPSRDNISKYAERKRLIDELISNINSQIGNLHWQPVIYQYQSLTFAEMLSLYTACDVALITPLRDGMNLVSKEFVASRKDGRGVLIISEMAGAARELPDALTINPNDTIEMADKIKEALEMEPAEQAWRMEKMQNRIAGYNVKDWAEDFMAELANIKKKQRHFQEAILDEGAKRNLLECFDKAGKRLLLLDYDGTLVPFCSKPEMAIPEKSLLDLLERLGSNDANDVFVISGRSSSWLDRHFGALPINLVAEHGAQVKWKGQAWRTEVQTHSEWKGPVHSIMERYVRRCAHSFVEEKEFSMVWHYRNSDTVQGKLRASELVSELRDCIYDQHLEVLGGNKIVEVRNKDTNKGTAIRKLMATSDYDFVFAVGDDKTDEDMFKTLVGKKNCFTIKVGPNASYAQYNLMKPQMVVSLLQVMDGLSVKALVQ